MDRLPRFIRAIDSSQSDTEVDGIRTLDLNLQNKTLRPRVIEVNLYSVICNRVFVDVRNRRLRCIADRPGNHRCRCNLIGVGSGNRSRVSVGSLNNIVVNSHRPHLVTKVDAETLLCRRKQERLDGIALYAILLTG